MIRSLIAVVLVGLCLTASANAAHPYHVSRADIHYNAQRGTFEVSLCVWPADLEKSIGQMEQKAIDLDTLTEAQRDVLIARYLTPRFNVLPVIEANAGKPVASNTPATGSAADKPATEPDPVAQKKIQPCEIRWVGSELDLKQAWLYFEVAAAPATKWTFENSMFFELNEDQLNQVQIESVGQRRRPGTSLFSRTLSANQPTVTWSPK